MSNLIHRLDASLPFSKTERIIIAIVVLLHALPAIIELLHWNPSAPKPDDERVMANLVSPDAAKSAQQQPPAAPPPKPKREDKQIFTKMTSSKSRLKSIHRVFGIQNGKNVEYNITHNVKFNNIKCISKFLADLISICFSESLFCQHPIPRKLRNRIFNLVI